MTQYPAQYQYPQPYQRPESGGFSSVEDLGMLLNLAPDEVDNLRDTAVFIRD